MRDNSNFRKNDHKNDSRNGNRKDERHGRSLGRVSDRYNSREDDRKRRSVRDMADDAVDEEIEVPENIEGRNAVVEAFRSGKTIDKLYVLDGCTDGAVSTIRREAKKAGTIVKFVSRERLDQISITGKHQGVIAFAAAYDYSEIEDI